jgi:hypothetical protein
MVMSYCRGDALVIVEVEDEIISDVVGVRSEREEEGEVSGILF